MKRILLPVVTAVLAAATSAQTLTYNVELIGGQEQPPNASGGIGTATVTVNTTTRDINISGTYSGLTSTVILAHLHGTARRGANAGVFVGLGHTGGTSGSFAGTGTLSATQLASLLAGTTYLNVHTSMFSGGEIRGQVDTVPGSGSAGAAAPTITGEAKPGGTLSISCPPTINPAFTILGLALPAGVTLPLPPVVACSTPTGIGIDVSLPIISVPLSVVGLNIPATLPSFEFAVQCAFPTGAGCIDMSAASRVAVRP